LPVSKIVSQLEELIPKMLEGSQRAVGKLITMAESYPEARKDITERLKRKYGNACVIGITGPPGAGKSSLVDRLIEQYRKDDKKVGIIAIDPSSTFSGGAFLGDRIRLRKHFTDDNVFIRSMGTRGCLGGITESTDTVIKILDAFGCDLVIVETVGIGQVEIDIVNVADIVILVLVPTLGDDIQAMKAGIMEIGDIFVFNKADYNTVDKAIAEVRAMFSLRQSDEETEDKPIIKTIATKNIGIEELKNTIYKTVVKYKDTGLFYNKRFERTKLELFDILIYDYENSIKNIIKENETEINKKIENIISCSNGSIYQLASDIKNKIKF